MRELNIKLKRDGAHFSAYFEDRADIHAIGSSPYTAIMNLANAIEYANFEFPKDDDIVIHHSAGLPENVEPEEKPGLNDEEKKLLEQGKLLAAVKSYHARTIYGLKDSKRVCDEYILKKGLRMRRE